MKQLALRSLAPECQVLSVVYGSIVDGQFTPSDFETAPTPIVEHVVSSTILGSVGYIPKTAVASLIKALGDRLDGVELFPNFLVLNIIDNEKSKEEDAR